MCQTARSALVCKRNERNRWKNGKRKPRGPGSQNEEKEPHPQWNRRSGRKGDDHVDVGEGFFFNAELNILDSLQIVKAFWMGRKRKDKEIQC